MKSKSILFMLLLFLTLIISIGAISAEDISTDSADVVDNVGNAAVNVPEIVGDGDDGDDDDDGGSSANTGNATSADSSAPAATSTAATSGSVKKTATKVSADQVAHEYKKSKYFKVKVKDKKGHYVKNVNIKLKIYTGSKSKVYTVKTNSKGIAKFNTKKLKLGKHKVVIRSGDSAYDIYKTSKIFIGKKHYTTLKLKAKKVLKNKDVLALKVVNDEDEKEVRVIYKKKPKYTMLTKAIFYLKNKNTGNVIKKTDHSEFDDGRWEVMDEDFSLRYVLLKVKVWYLSSK